MKNKIKISGSMHFKMRNIKVIVEKKGKKEEEDETQ